MIATLYVMLVVGAFFLSFVSLVNSKGDSLLGWAVFFLTLALMCGVR